MAEGIVYSTQRNTKTTVMADEGPPPLKKQKLRREDIEHLSKEEILDKWYEQQSLLENLTSKQGFPHNDGDNKVDEDIVGREGEKTKQLDASRRENILVMRLASKEQEMQEYMNQIAEMKQAQNPSTAQLRSMLLDPAINLMFQRMRKDMDAYKEKLEQAQNDLAAWKFTPDSQTGKRLMAKCRMLLQENEELGKVISSGRTAKLEGQIALEKTLVQEMKKSQAEMDEFVMELDEDVEMLQGTIYVLQQQLKDCKEQLTNLQKENEGLRNSLAEVKKSNIAQAPESPMSGNQSRDSTKDSKEEMEDVSCQNSLRNSERTRSPVSISTQDVSNHNVEKTANPTKTTNGGSSHGNMETDLSDSQAEEDDSAAVHRQFLNNQQQKQQTNNKLDLKTHRTPSSSSSQNQPPSDSADAAEHTDGTSSESWSPQRAPNTRVEENMDQADMSSQRTADKSEGLRPIPNGALSPPAHYGSQGEEEEED